MIILLNKVHEFLKLLFRILMNSSWIGIVQHLSQTLSYLEMDHQWNSPLNYSRQSIERLKILHRGIELVLKRCEMPLKVKYKLVANFDFLHAVL